MLENLLLGMEAAVAFFIGLVCVFLALEAVLGPLINRLSRPPADKLSRPK